MPLYLPPSSSSIGLPLGLTGATAATRYVGGATSVPPASGTFAVGDFVIAQNGRVWVCITAGSPGTWVDAAQPLGALAVGQESLPRALLSAGSVACVASELALTYFTATRAETCTQIEMWTSDTAAAPTPSLCRMGLWSIAANGNGTLVAATPNDTALWAAVWTHYALALSANYTTIIGQRYALGFLIVTAGATPTFPGSWMALASERAPQTSGLIVGKTDLPATFSAGDAWGGKPYYMILMP